MANIKFDGEKVDALIRDLGKISSDIDSNMGKIYTNSYGKEINLNDSRLKAYDYRTKTIDVFQDDGTTVQETIKEKYLKSNYVANARLYNQHVRNLYKKSNSAKTKATQSIESVINSLNKIKSLISEFESEQNIRFSTYLDDVGQFDFNFLSAYGPMGMPNNYSSSLGAVVVDEAYTSLHLGILGERPTSINLEKLPIFDGMLDIARNNAMSYQEKINQVKGLLMNNVLAVNPEEMEAKAKNALESMVGIAKSNDIKIDDNLRIETLVNVGVPVLENLESSNLSTNFEYAGGTIVSGLAVADAFIDGAKDKVQTMIQNMDLNQDGHKDLDINRDGHVELPEVNKEKIKDQLGIKTEINVSKDDRRESSMVPSNSNHREDGNHQEIGNHEDSNNNLNQSRHTLNSSIDRAKSVVKDAVNNNNNHMDNGSRILGKIGNGSKIENGNQNKTLISEAMPKLNSESAMKDVIENKEVAKSQIIEENKLSSEDMTLDKELLSTKITNVYKNSAIEDSSDASTADIKLNDVVDEKGAGVLAGAAGLGSLTSVGKPSGAASAPQVNGMAAGEVLGINNSDGSASMGMIVRDTTNSSISNGTVVNGGTKIISSGGEATADRGSLSINNSSSKSSNISVSGGGSSTLEDKDSGNGENSYGKPNKTNENNDAINKGMLGDASIAELDAKDEKQIKIATGVTAVTVLGAGVLALANVLPWVMLILALLAIVIYAGCRSKKKKDKEKRRAALAAKKAAEVAKTTVTIENVQNVSDSVETKAEEPATVTSVTENIAPPIQTVESDGEFSSQPYEPSRDGITEIIASNNAKTE